MKLFEMNEWELHVSEQAWSLSPFKRLLKKDRTKDKEKANKEMLFLWFYTDLKSDYQHILSDELRKEELKKDLELGDKWEISKELHEAINFYKERSTTTSEKLLKDSRYVADKVSSRLREYMDNEQLSIQDLSRITAALKQMPDIVLSLQKTEAAVIKERNIIEENNVGSQEKNIFENGLDFDE